MVYISMYPLGSIVLPIGFNLSINVALKGHLWYYFLEVVIFMSDLGDYIQERRLAKEWSKRKLAIKSNISHSEVHRIENGERTNPSVPVLNSLAEALGVPKDEILRVAGYKADDGDIPLIEKLFPDLKTSKQQETAQKIIDGLSRNADLQDVEYDDLARQVEMFLDYAKKKRDT